MTSEIISLKCSAEPRTNPWGFLLRYLRHGNEVQVSQSELSDAGFHPGDLLGSLIQYGCSDGTLAPCSHRSPSRYDYRTRAATGQVGVACTAEPPCWDGWAWLEVQKITHFRVSAEPVCQALAEASGLGPLSLYADEYTVPIGLLRRREREIPVIWVRENSPLVKRLCVGIARQLGYESLIALTLGSEVETIARGQVIIAPLRFFSADSARLDLIDALDELDPGYRKRAVNDSELELDHVQLTFGTEPGQRHLVYLNGRLFEGFQKSDLRFLRLLLMALERKRGEEEGWFDRAALVDGSARDIELLRSELTAPNEPTTNAVERGALIRIRKGRNQARLGVPAENISFLPSLQDLTLLSTERRLTTQDQKESAEVAQQLLRKCREQLVERPTRGVP